jgi:acyl-CoA dehydrogenase
MNTDSGDAQVRLICRDRNALRRVGQLGEQLQQTESIREYSRAAMAKLSATELAQQVIDRAVQLHGGRGVRVGEPVERLYRDIRALRIYEGASEVQRLLIGRGNDLRFANCR